MNKIYTVDDAATLLDVSVKTIRRYIYSGKIAANKIGGQWRMSQEQIDAYFESISSANTCCQSSIGQDDFCVFMDTEYFASDDPLQLCTIVDYYQKTSDEIVKVSEVLSRVVTEDGIKGGKAQYNYIYDEALSRARFVLWGSATFIEKAAGLLKPFEGGQID